MYVYVYEAFHGNPVVINKLENYKLYFHQRWYIVDSLAVFNISKMTDTARLCFQTLHGNDVKYFMEYLNIIFAITLYNPVTHTT